MSTLSPNKYAKPNPSKPSSQSPTPKPENPTPPKNPQLLHISCTLNPKHDISSYQMGFPTIWCTFMGSCSGDYIGVLLFLEAAIHPFGSLQAHLSYISLHMLLCACKRSYTSISKPPLPPTLNPTLQALNSNSKPQHPSPKP